MKEIMKQYTQLQYILKTLHKNNKKTMGMFARDAQ